MQFKVSYKLEFSEEELEELANELSVIGAGDDADTVRQALTTGLLVPSNKVEFDVQEDGHD